MPRLQVDVGSGLPWPLLAKTPPKGRRDSSFEGPSGSRVQHRQDARLVSWVGQGLGEHVGYLLGCVRLDQQMHLTMLDDFMREVPAGVDVLLRTLPSADNVVTPLDARRLVLVHWRIRFLLESHTLEHCGRVQRYSTLIPISEVA